MAESGCNLNAESTKSIIDLVYPVGSYYWSSNATNPSELFGGTWEQIKDRFVLAAGDNYSAGSSGGEASHTLSVDELPWHKHDVYVRVQGYDGWDTYTSYDYGVMFQNNGTVGYHGPNYTAHSAVVTADAKTNGTGSSKSHNNMPPYITAYCWHRTA